jgi:hypothetical protein
MWSLAASLLTWILGLFGFGKPDPNQIGRDAGHGDDAITTLKNVEQANEASGSVAADVAVHPGQLRQPDPFERPN